MSNTCIYSFRRVFFFPGLRTWYRKYCPKFLSSHPVLLCIWEGRGRMRGGKKQWSKNAWRGCPGLLLGNSLTTTIYNINKAQTESKSEESPEEDELEPLPSEPLSSSSSPLLEPQELLPSNSSPFSFLFSFDPCEKWQLTVNPIQKVSDESVPGPAVLAPLQVLLADSWLMKTTGLFVWSWDSGLLSWSHSYTSQLASLCTAYSLGEKLSEPEVQIHPVLFLQLLSLAFIRFLQAMGQAASVGQSLLCIFSQVNVAAPSWSWILVKFMISHPWGASWAVHEISPSWEIYQFLEEIAHFLHFLVTFGGL